jgi:hypothetical protein
VGPKIHGLGEGEMEERTRFDAGRFGNPREVSDFDDGASNRWRPRSPLADAAEADAFATPSTSLAVPEEPETTDAVSLPDFFAVDPVRGRGS